MSDDRKIYLDEAYRNANQLLSHPERNVRDLAIVVISLIREVLPTDMIQALEKE